MVSNRLQHFALALLLLPGLSLADSNLHQRSHLPPGSANKLMHLRLQAMMSEERKTNEMFGDGYMSYGSREDGCNLNIGNRVGESINTDSQNIYIDGPVINYCR